MCLRIEGFILLGMHRSGTDEDKVGVVLERRTYSLSYTCTLGIGSFGMYLGVIEVSCGLSPSLLSTNTPFIRVFPSFSVARRNMLLVSRSRKDQVKSPYICPIAWYLSVTGNPLSHLTDLSLIHI